QGQGQPAPGGGGSGAPAVGEEFAWRRRAIAAEEKAAQLQARLDGVQSKFRELEAEVVRARTGLTEAKRRRGPGAERGGAGGVARETARLLAERAMGEGGGGGGTADSDPDPAAVVADLKRRKPFLFRSAARPSSMSALATPGGASGTGGDPARDLAQQA